MVLRYPTFFLIVLSGCQFTLQSPSSSYSLQSAVDALSNREDILRDELENENLEDLIDNDFEWNNDFELNREQNVPENRVLTRYTARPVPDYDENFLGYRKRFMNRKRDPSVFRERSRLPSNRQQHELAEKFLKAIEDEREKEREVEYREQLRNLWSRYQKEENDIEKELFSENENDVESEYPINYEDINQKKKKRQRGEVEVAPQYWNDKRSMPLLPWLPAQRKKRFPVTKRSPNLNENDLISKGTESNDKISRDLQGIFGAVESVRDDNTDEKRKKKRSNEELNHQHLGHDEKLETVQQHSTMASHADDKKRDVKRSASDDDDDEDDASDEVEGEEDDSEENEERKRKKKRETKKNTETPSERNFPDNTPNLASKKSVQWSKYFGFDRKKKMYGPRESIERRKKQCSVEEDCGVPDNEEYDDSEEDSEHDQQRRKKNPSRGDDRLNAMDRKLEAIQNIIIADTAKHYGNLDEKENLSPSEVNAVKNQLADRLATAYSLEKMRQAISRLRKSIAVQKSLEKNLLVAENASSGNDDDENEKKKAKRVAVKKEKVDFDNNDHEIDSSVKKINEDSKNNLSADEEDKEKKKKKRSQKKSELNNIINDETEPLMSEGSMGGRVFQNYCPILDAIEKRCRGVDIYSGDSHHNLLEACGAHQLCYLCGESETQCDYRYVYDVKDICEHNSRCKTAAAAALSALRSFSFSGSKVGPRECIRNPCLSSALRSIGY